MFNLDIINRLEKQIIENNNNKIKIEFFISMISPIDIAV